MSALEPPPLPDVPFARLAGSAAAGADSYALRPVSRVARIFLALPLPVLLLLAAGLLARAYQTGSHFVHNINYAFVWFFHAAVFGVVAGAVLLPAAVTLGVTWRRLERRARFRAEAGGVAAVGVALLAVWFSGKAFQAGKSNAYAAVNVPLLVADCKAMAASLASGGNERREEFVEGKDPSLPAYLRSLQPRYVSVRPDSVEVIMAHDYFSGTNHESFIVPVGPLAEDPTTYAARPRMAVISTEPPVFRLLAQQ